MEYGVVVVRVQLVAAAVWGKTEQNLANMELVKHDRHDAICSFFSFMSNKELAVFFYMSVPYMNDVFHSASVMLRLSTFFLELFQYLLKARLY